MFVSFRHVTFEWPDGHSVFKNLNLNLEARRYGLVGPNGAGKSTLARLLTGDLAPTGGTVERARGIFHLAQSAPPPQETLAEWLTAAAVWDHGEAVTLVASLDPARRCDELSGGQWMRARLAAAVASGARNLILDEPTNDLDAEGRGAVMDFVRVFSGGLLVISHDRALLREMDEILELSSQGLSRYGGNWDFYDRARAQERERAERGLENAKRERAKAAAERVERLAAQDKRERDGEARGFSLGLSRLALGAMKRRAQVSRGRVDATTSEAAEQAHREAAETYRRMKTEAVMFVDLPQPALHTQDVILSLEDFNFRFDGSGGPLWATPLTAHFTGPVKLALRGPNGSGKSTLLKLIAGTPLTGRAAGRLTVPPRSFAVIDQRLEQLDDGLSVLENVRRTASVNDTVLRNLLAEFQFRGDQVFQTAGSLSGGERLRAALAQALLREETPAVLLLDEPTNHLDLGNLKFLEGFLREFRGAVIAVSHDEDFLREAGLTEELTMTKPKGGP